MQNDSLVANNDSPYRVGTAHLLADQIKGNEPGKMKKVEKFFLKKIIFLCRIVLHDL